MLKVPQHFTFTPVQFEKQWQTFISTTNSTVTLQAWGVHFCYFFHQPLFKMEKIRILRTLAYISDSSIDIGVTTQSLEKMSFMLLSCQYQHKKKNKKKKPWYLCLVLQRTSDYWLIFFLLKEKKILMLCMFFFFKKKMQKYIKIMNKSHMLLIYTLSLIKYIRFFVNH